ncbi:MAG: class I SAM-dependent methyltransferase [Nitrospirales bacterium]|nr:class I SAM-dependent methyltransferase [Nitrospirales bacterium]
MLTKRFERLNALADLISASTYLEIGVAKGKTFMNISVPYKVGVDPHFKFNFHDHADQNTIFYEVTSDFFFSKLAPGHSEFDLIYLDGLHTFEQTFRDFCASIRYSHENTIWLIDDTCPNSWLAGQRNLRIAKKLRKSFGIKNQTWMGDVFKVVFAIHDFFPQFSYSTFSEHGQTAVWVATRKNFAPTWNSLAKISRLGYRDFLKFRDSHLLVVEDQEIFEAVEMSRIRSN